jgi:predicted transglutaminase-like protease
MAVLTPDFKTTLISKNQTSKDIVKGICKAINESTEASKEIAKKFYDKDPVKTCEKVWHYLKNNFHYSKESSNEQSSKSMARLLYDKYGDCKHYTIFSYAILEALGIPVVMRLVSQKILDKDPTHIYTVAQINGREYIVDPVMNDFNQECKHNYKCDLKTSKAMMQHLSGTHDLSEMGKNKKHPLSDALKKEAQKRKSTFKKIKTKHDEILKKQGKTIKKGIKRFAHIQKDVAVKSFLLSVAKNYMGLANRIKDANKTHPADLKMFWAKFGAWQDLVNAVNKGSKQGAIFSGIGEDETGGSSSSGGGQAGQYEEGAKASVGIIKQILEFFAKRKKEKQAGDDKSVEALADAVDKDPTIPKVDENGNTIAPDGSKDDGADDETPFYKKPVVLGTTAVVLVGGYMLMKK